MKYFRHEIDSDQVNLYPLVCWHVGAKQSSQKFIDKVIETILADPQGLAIYMGDAGECVTKFSKGNIYEQQLSPGDQLRVAADLMKPIADQGKLLFGIRGNHGNRIDRETGVGWDEVLCARVGIPYMGVSAFGDILLKADRTTTAAVSVYTHHGSAGAIGAAGKMAAGHRPKDIVLADVALTAHTHACGECWPPRHLAFTEAHSRRIKYATMRMFVCGSAYDSRSGYAEEKQYPVLLPEHIVVNISVGRKNGKTVIEVDHRTLKGFAEEFVSEDNATKWVG